MTTDTGLIERAEELLPCPFCGGRASFRQNTIDFLPVWDVQCHGCAAQVECGAEEKEDAATTWNTRALLASPAPAGAEGFYSMESAPNDGRWICAVSNDGSELYRVSWGRDRSGELRWCSATKSYGVGLFGGWFPCPQSIHHTAASPAPAQATPPAVCHVCGEQTETACADCQITFSATVYVCSKASCRDAHERKCFGPGNSAPPPAEARELVEFDPFPYGSQERVSTLSDRAKKARQYVEAGGKDRWIADVIGDLLAALPAVPEVRG